MPDDSTLELRRRLAADLRQQRQNAGLTQAEIGKLFGWNRDAVSKLEAGHNRISLDDYLIIARHLVDANPGHPAHALVAAMHPAGIRRTAG